MKNLQYAFCRDFSSEFCYDDITVIAFINIKYGDIVVEIIHKELCSVIRFL